MDKAEQARWVETMPILASISRRETPPGEFVRDTEWGSLYREGDYFHLLANDGRRRR